MMKSIVAYLLTTVVCISTCLASIADDPEIADGYLTNGEYVSMGKVEGYEELFVTGGGAETIDVRDHGYLEVQDTAKPLGYHTGIYDIFLYDDSELLYLGGITEEITVRDDATAVLKGGRVDYITIYHLSSWSSNVTIYCQEGYTKTDSYIYGLWADGTSFYIEFIDVDGVFSPYPTADYVTVIPEPATLVLLGLGGLLLRKRRL